MRAIALAYVFFILAIVAFGIYMMSGTECGDGVCSGAEDCSSCLQDCRCQAGERCIRGVCERAAKECGDGTCSADEDCISCPQDCKCRAGERCIRGVCEPAAKECGDGTCSDAEDCISCPEDCTCPPGQVCNVLLARCMPAERCGDGICSAGEGCASCPKDCWCGSGQYCDRKADSCKAPVCGNSLCEPGEDQYSCCTDCPCTVSGMICIGNACAYPPSALSDSEAEELAIASLDRFGLTYLGTVLVRDHILDGAPAKAVTLQVMELSQPCILIVKDNREVIRLDIL